MIIFVKPWKGYVPGERAGFSPANEEVLLRTGWAVRNPGDIPLQGDGSAQQRAQAAAAAEGRPQPAIRRDGHGGEVARTDLLNHVGADAPGARPAAPVAAPGGRAAEPEPEADAARPEELVGRKRR